MEELVQIKPIESSEPFDGVTRIAIAFVGGKETGNQPKSCFNCPFFYINQKTCQIHGPDIVIDSLVKDGQLYTPVCIYQTGGTPVAVDDSEVIYNATLLGEKKAEATGLEWAKGPGTNCGGFKEGASCIHFHATDGKGIDGICGLMKVKQEKIGEHENNEVDWDDCCNGHEGEHITWQEAQKLLASTKKIDAKGALSGIKRAKIKGRINAKA